MHIIGATKDLQYAKTHNITFEQAGFLFIDFKQAFDSVSHELLLKKLEEFPNNNKEWN